MLGRSRIGISWRAWYSGAMDGNGIVQVGLYRHRS